MKNHPTNTPHNGLMELFIYFLHCLLKIEAKYSIKNVELIEKEKASVSVFNKAMFFDFCVYGNIKTVQGKMFIPDSNAENLFHSSEVIGIEQKFKKNDLVSWARKLIAKNNIKDALIRMLLIGQEKDEIKENHLIIPPTEKVLGGLTREIIREISSKILELKEEDIPLSEIGDYDGNFLTGSTIKIMPVGQIDDKILRTKAGEKVRKLQELCERYTYDKYIE